MFSLTVSIWGGLLCPLFISTDYSTALFWARILNYFAIFIPIFFFHFILEFIKLSSKKIWFLGPAYLTAIVLLIVAFLFPNHFVPSVSPKIGITFYTDAGIIFYLFAIYFSLLVCLGFILLIRHIKSFTSPTAQQKEQFKLLLGAMAVGFGGGSTTFLLVFNIPIYPIGIFGPAVLALTIGYAITKYELMNISATLSKNISNIIVLSLIFTTSAITYYIVKQHSAYLLIGITCNTVIWGFMAMPLRAYLITTTKRKFVKGWYDDKRMIAELGKNLSLVFNSNEAIQIIQDTIDDFLQLDCAIVRANIDKVNHATLNDNGHEITIPVSINAKFDHILVLGARESGSKYTRGDLMVITAAQHQINTALERIKFFNELQEINKNLEVLVEEKVAEAEQAKAYAQKVAQQASFGTLTKGIAHELRNPLGMIMGLSEGLHRKIKKDANKDKLLELATDITKGAERLTQILEAMLEFGTATSQSKNEIILIKNAINKAAHLLKAECNAKGIQLNLDYGNDLRVVGDEGLISQVIFNLILNGIQAIEARGEKNGQIDVVCAEVEGDIIMSVTDNGYGISEDEKAKIFDAFHTTKYESTGLGLSLSLQIMEQHGGEIQFDSEEGKGSTFRLVFPKG